MCLSHRGLRESENTEARSVGHHRPLQWYSWETSHTVGASVIIHVERFDVNLQHTVGVGVCVIPASEWHDAMALITVSMPLGSTHPRPQALGTDPRLGLGVVDRVR